MAGLRICTYNSHGSGASRLEYVKYLCCHHDLVFIQEHWLRNCEIHKYVDYIDYIDVHGSSSMADNELLVGRPHGGTAILWRKSLGFKVIPIDVNSNRLCAVRLTGDDIDILMFCVYMPCDTEYVLNKIVLNIMRF